MFEEFLASKSEIPFIGDPTTPVEHPELATRYKLEAKLVLRDEALANLPSLVTSISSIVNSYWTETRSANNIPESKFEYFFSESFLENSIYCITDICPSLDFRSLGIKPNDMPHGKRISGISFGDSYFVSTKDQCDLGIHFHELIHGVQAKILGLPAYLTAYVSELVLKGYRNNFFEKMAYNMQRRYLYLGNPFDVSQEVLNEIKNHSLFK